jgi:LPXTG-motif cell wall-anchored protein
MPPSGAIHPKRMVAGGEKELLPRQLSGRSVGVAVFDLNARDGPHHHPFDIGGISKVRETLVFAHRMRLHSPIPSVSPPFKTEQSEHAAPRHNQSTMDTTTLIIVLLVVLLLGGGGFYYRGRRRI